MDLELLDFSRSSNNLPLINTDRLRHRFMNWRQWRSNHPYEPILDEEANREINSNNWEHEEGYQNYGEEINQETNFGENYGESVNIDIPETTSLLGNTAGIATAGGGVSASLPAIGTGIAIGGGAVLAGGIAAVIKKGQSGEGYTLPGSEYIGPGNPVNIDAAKNSADQTAKEHDIEYGRIEKTPLSDIDFKQQVIDADNTAIDNFEKNWKEDGHINAKIGSIGLQVKQNVEHLVGHPLYPKRK